MQIIDSLKDLSENLPLKRLVGIEWVGLHEILKGLTVTKLHLDVEDVDSRLQFFLARTV